MTAPATQMPSFQDPAALGALSPSIRELEGRVVFIQPTRIDYQVPGVGPNAKPQDRITCDITIVDGGQLPYGSKQQPVPTPATHVIATPCTFTGVFVSNVNIVNAVKDALPGPGRPTPGLVLGEIKRGITAQTGNNAPWNLITLEASDPRRVTAQTVLSSIIMRTFVNPTGVPIGAPPAAAPAPATAPPAPYIGGPADYAAYQAGLLPTPPPVTGPPMDPAYAAYLAAQQRPAAPIAPPAPPAPPVDPGYAAYLAAQQATATPMPAAPMGWPDEAWRMMSPEQRSSILAAHGGAPL